MIVDHEKYSYLKNSTNAIIGMQKIISSLRKDIKKVQATCSHHLFLITDLKVNNQKQTYTLVCPACLLKKKVSSLTELSNQERILIDVTSYPNLNDASESERITEILDLFYSVFNDHDITHEAELGYELNKRIARKLKQKQDYIK